MKICQRTDLICLFPRVTLLWWASLISWSGGTLLLLKPSTMTCVFPSRMNAILTSFAYFFVIYLDRIMLAVEAESMQILQESTVNESDFVVHVASGVPHPFRFPLGIKKVFREPKSVWGSPESLQESAVKESAFVVHVASSMGSAFTTTLSDSVIPNCSHLPR